MDGRGTFLFVFRASPDVDHMAPLAWKLLKEGDEVHAVISPGYEPEADHRLELLRGFERFHIHRIDRPAGPRWLRAARAYLRSTLPYALALLRRSGARVVAVEWGYGLPAGYDRLRSPAGAVALLRSFGRSLLKARSDPQQVRSNFIVSARVLGVPTVCLPHGLNIKFDNATNTQLLEMFESGSLEMKDRNRFDAFVFNTEFHRQWFLNHAGGDPAVMQTWGSLRWSPEWFDVNRRLAPRFEWPEDTDRVKVVFMIPKWQNRTRVEEAVDLVLRLQELDGISLALMGHPRHGRKSFGPLLEEPGFDLDRVHDVTGQSSVSLIDACDVVIDVGSSIGLEVVMQGKVLVNPAYIHEIKTVFDTIEGASVTVQSADEAVDYLRAHASGRPHEVPEEAYAELMRQMVYGSREAPFDVLEEYGSRVRALSRS
ncbi:MAG TPA: hypothetical protein VEX39_18100 [Thermoleophilaceae bacterium]|nr:hypothetical protein [Thermoleophilaceae bacterium]